MDIFIMRHGEAEMNLGSDQARKLNERGIQQAYEQGIWLKNTALFEKVLVSPYVRAQETFAQINHVFEDSLRPKQETWKGITPYGNAPMVVEYLDVLVEQGVQSVLIISHLPLVGEIVASLCGKNTARFYPSTVAHVVWDGQTGHLQQVSYLG
ncbi:phosphohistidine phosphatase SixA [Pasteurella sp. PK-2025]|uniref:phosphohistidine phosphatase SixA n=1 Tax=unclassified Pasteurella TaxID=2621516 RepID=UPI003C787326